MWIDILLVLIGAILGFILSICTTIITKAMDKKGTLHLFYIITQPTEAVKNNIYADGVRSSLILPFVFEFQNTSNTTRVIRDVSLYLYKEGKLVAKMLQAQNYTVHRKSGDEHKNFGGEKCSYSFVLEPLSIQRQYCQYWHSIPLSKENEIIFDTIKFAYYDEKNRLVESLIYKTDKIWKDVRFEHKEEFTLIQCKNIKK